VVAVSTTDFDAAVTQLMQLTSCNRGKAEAIIRQQAPHLAPPPNPGEAELRENVLEKQEQAEVVKILRAHGCVVYSLSQARASKQTPGLPDLWVFHPRAHAAFWFEVKRSVGGMQSGAQAEFQSLCFGSGVRYVLGDRCAAWDVLRTIGVVTP
jgi:hypothetical protein